ncbi:MAG: hypothetical protein IKF90_02100 [Parasporobacterium sp.]|nr:hypothetical protein [Parasporobacterium sp.]
MKESVKTGICFAIVFIAAALLMYYVVQYEKDNGSHAISRVFFVFYCVNGFYMIYYCAIKFWDGVIL